MLGARGIRPTWASDYDIGVTTRYDADFVRFTDDSEFRLSQLFFVVKTLSLGIFRSSNVLDYSHPR